MCILLSKSSWPGNDPYFQYPLPLCNWLCPSYCLLSPFFLLKDTCFLKQKSGPSAARTRSHNWPHTMWLRGWPLNKQKQFSQDFSPLPRLLGVIQPWTWYSQGQRNAGGSGSWNLKLNLWAELDSHIFSSFSCPLLSAFYLYLLLQKETSNTRKQLSRSKEPQLPCFSIFHHR